MVTDESWQLIRRESINKPNWIEKVVYDTLTSKWFQYCQCFVCLFFKQKNKYTENTDRKENVTDQVLF